MKDNHGELDEKGNQTQHKRHHNDEDSPGGVDLPVPFCSDVFGLEGGGNFHLVAEVEVGVKGFEDFGVVETHGGEGNDKV